MRGAPRLGGSLLREFPAWEHTGGEPTPTGSPGSGTECIATSALTLRDVASTTTDPTKPAPPETPAGPDRPRAVLSRVPPPSLERRVDVWPERGGRPGKERTYLAF